MPKITNIASRHIHIDGYQYLYFSGTSYLGIHDNAEFKALVIEGMQKYGVHYGGSRFSNTVYDIFDLVESQISALCGDQNALLLSSGTLAGQLLSNFLCQPNKICWALPGTHPALVVDKSNFFQLSQKNWEKQLKSSFENVQTEHVILANSMDPLYCQPSHFGALLKIIADNKCTLVLDDSHAIGIYKHGTSKYFSQVNTPDNINLIVTSSIGKAFGIPAGIILTKKDTINHLKQLPSFGGASPPPVSFLYAFSKSQHIYESEKEKLTRNIQYFTKLGKDFLPHFNYIAGYPVFYSSNQSLATFLKTKGIIISSFAYPDPEGELINRIVLSSLHTKNDIEFLISALSDFFN